MYEAAVAHREVTGDDTFLDVARKNADLICRVFNADNRTDPPGHQEIEIGLCRLYRATGDEKYLEQAKFFLDQRGRKGRRGPDGNGGLYGTYAQDHIPVVEQKEAVGHSVRAASPSGSAGQPSQAARPRIARSMPLVTTIARASPAIFFFRYTCSWK